MVKIAHMQWYGGLQRRQNIISFLGTVIVDITVGADVLLGTATVDLTRAFLGEALEGWYELRVPVPYGVEGAAENSGASAGTAAGGDDDEAEGAAPRPTVTSGEVFLQVQCDVTDSVYVGEVKEYAARRGLPPKVRRNALYCGVLRGVL